MINIRRVIPSLLILGSDVVKGISYSDYQYVGDPVNIIRIFNEKQVDEIIIYDIGASSNKCINFELLSEMAAECFMPLTYGGGISSIEQCGQLLSLGIEKISFNTCALKNILLVNLAAKKFGSQSVSVTVDFYKKDTEYFVYSHLKKHVTPILVKDHVLVCEQAGAGEIVLSSVNKEGSLSGLDYEIVSQISSSLSIPLVISGGANSTLNILGAFDIGASGVAVGSYFIYHGPHRAVLIDVPDFS